MNSLLEVIEGVRPLLDAWGPTTFGAQQVWREAKPRRWVWVPQSESFTAPDTNGSLHKCLASVQIHCWGLSETECQQMRSAVISAIRRVVNGRRYQPTSGQWTERLDSHRGAALVLAVNVELDVPTISLPLGSNTIGDITFDDALVEEVPITPEVGS